MDDEYDYQYPLRASRYLEPHRGATVLVLGILSLVLCAPLGIPAWVMGNNDLAAMQNGRMDRSGEGLTRAGQVLGIIGTIIFILGFCAFGLGVLSGLGR